MFIFKLGLTKRGGWKGYKRITNPSVKKLQKLGHPVMPGAILIKNMIYNPATDFPGAYQNTFLWIEERRYSS